MVENCCPLSKSLLLRLQTPGSLWGCFLSPPKVLDIPQCGKQLTKDCFSVGCGLPEMPRGHVGNHLASTNLVFGRQTGQTVSQAAIGLIIPSLPWKETSRTADTNGSIGAEPMRHFIVASHQGHLVQTAASTLAMSKKLQMLFHKSIPLA